MFDYVYFYPKDYGAPSDVARNIFDSLIRKKLPYSLAVFPSDKRTAVALKSKYPNIKIISFRDLLFYKRNTIVHIPVSPTFFLNNKFFIFLISTLKRYKLIINYHGEPRLEYALRFKNHRIKEIVLSFPTYLVVPLFVRSADIVVLNSLSMKEKFGALYKSKHIEVIPNALQSYWFDTTNMDEIALNDYEFSIFYHGRLSPEKGVDILLKAFYKFLRSTDCHPYSVKLYIAGEGEQYDNLKLLARELNINDHVIFLGKIPLAELKSYLVSVNAAIYPSIYEPFSLAVLEAFALVNGPVLYSRTIGINDFVQDRGLNFFTFVPTVDGIANAIRDLYFKNYNTNIHFEQKSFSNELTWEKVVDQYISLYSKLV
jgi:glycosyltransferase involved in cell wall biosynthesis